MTSHATVAATPTVGRARDRDGLSARLRAGTRQEHAEAEAAFDVPVAFADLASYGATLLRLHGWYAGVERALAGSDELSAWASDGGLDLDPWFRVPLLHNDLARLGVTSAERDAPADPVLVGLPQALGWLYVVAGSALGGRLLGKGALSRLGMGTPVAFLQSGQRDIGPAWRALALALDRSGVVAADSHTHCVSAVLGARAAFAGFRVMVRPGAESA